jgi:hypothetical protein
VAAIDIGFGGSGSEVVVVSNLVIPYQSAYIWQGDNIAIPLQVPAGTRVSCRIQENVAGGAADASVSMQFFGSSFAGCEGFSGVAAIGFTPASSAMTTISASNAVKGAYAQMVASSANDYCGLFMVANCTSSNPTVFDIAVGGAGSEIVIVPNIYMVALQIYVPFFPVNIPAGTRIAVRGASLSGAATTPPVVLYGVYL